MKNEELNYTRFIPSPEPVSSIKKWIAHSEGFAKGELHINHCATELLFSDKAVSILRIDGRRDILTVDGNGLTLLEHFSKALG